MVIGYGETGGADVNELEQKGFKLKHIPMKRGSLNLVYNLITILKIWNFFREEKPDIAHLVTIKPYLYGGLISRFLSVPCLVSAVSGLGALFISNDLKTKVLLFFYTQFLNLLLTIIIKKLLFRTKMI